MGKINNDDPAYPTIEQGSNGQWNTVVGLTKREYFAAMAMQGLCANYLRENVSGWGIKTYAVESVMLADALIAELNK